MLCDKSSGSKCLAAFRSKRFWIISRRFEISGKTFNFIIGHSIIVSHSSESWNLSLCSVIPKNHSDDLRNLMNWWRDFSLEDSHRKDGKKRRFSFRPIAIGQAQRAVFKS
jgi:hypothetical protein